MPSQLEESFRNGSDVIAAAAQPRPADSIRARGDQRRRRQAIGSAITVVAIVAAGSAAVTQLGRAHRVGTPAPASGGQSHHSHHVARPAVQVVIVPNAVGLPAPTAESLLTAAGFRVIIQVSTCGNTALHAGTVCYSEPAAGAQVLVGATVVIDVALQRPQAP